MDAMRSDMDRYRESFELEERRLRGGIEAIGTVASRLAESRAKYQQVLEQIEERSGHFLSFIGQEEERFMQLRRIRVSLDGTLGDIEAVPCERRSDGMVGGEGEMGAIRRSVSDAGEEGDYRRMMLLSFLAKCARERSKRKEAPHSFRRGHMETTRTDSRENVSRRCSTSPSAWPTRYTGSKC